MRRTPIFVLRIFPMVLFAQFECHMKTNPLHQRHYFMHTDECTRARATTKKIFTFRIFSAIFGLLVWVEIPVGIFHLSTLVVVRRVNLPIRPYICDIDSRETFCTTFTYTQSLYYIVSHSWPLGPHTFISPKTWENDYKNGYSVILLDRFVSKIDWHAMPVWAGCLSPGCVHLKLIRWRLENEWAKTSERNFPLIILFYSCK